jgi:5-formyltetrahydrofolate cyclo-ligase
MNKRELRSEYRRVRHGLMPGLNASLIQSVLAHLNDQKRPHRQGAIGITWPLPGEPDLRLLAELQPTPLALPATAQDYSITYHHWNNAPSPIELRGDAFSIPAPLSSPALKPAELALLLIPALAIDQRGMRLGYGGGCYDRLLSQPGWSTLPTFAVLPMACLHPTLLPAEPWDQPLDGWITEQGCSLRRASQQSESSAR